MIGIRIPQPLPEGVPVLHGLCGQHLVLICQTPPDIPVSPVTGHHIIQIGQAVFPAHLGKSPPVIGMEENQIRFDAEPSKTSHPVVQITPESVLGPVYIPASVRPTGKGKQLRFLLIIGHEFRENQHADLVKAGCGQGLHRLVLQFPGLVNPCIAGGAKGQIFCPILVAEMILLCLHQAM